MLSPSSKKIIGHTDVSKIVAFENIDQVHFNIFIIIMKDKNIIIFYGGLILLQYLVKFLKKIIKEDRPIKSKTYGMPSTKSATLFYIMTYLMIMNNIEKRTKIILFMLAIVGILYKLMYKEHSYEQVIIGAIIGIFYAYIVKYITNLN